MNKQNRKYGFVIWLLLPSGKIKFEKVLPEKDAGRYKYLDKVRTATVYNTKKEALGYCTSIPVSEGIARLRTAKVSLYKNGRARKVLKLYKEFNPVGEGSAP